MSSIEQLRLDSDRRLVSVVLSLLLIPALWFVRVDFQFYTGDPFHLSIRLALRGLLAMACVAGPILMWRVRTRAQYGRWVLGLAVAISFAVLALNAARPEGSGLPLRSPLIHLIVLYAALPNRTQRQCWPPLALSVGLIMLRVVWLNSPENSDVAGDVLSLIVVNATGVLTVRRREALERAVDLTVTELRTLRGIIPICMHCRQVRTDLGDWQQLERYVHDHCDATFSHGICPNCLPEHYPEAQRLEETGALR